MFWKRKRKDRDRYQLNPKGIYSIHYVINKYLNQQEIDNIAAYEELIDKCQKRLEEAKYYDYVKHISPDIHIEDPEVRHTFAAMMWVSITLRVLIPEEREKCLELITNEDFRKNFEEHLNSKLFNF